MWVPWKPEIPDERRVELARHWLKFLGLEVTEERVTKIKRHVMFYHPLSPKGQVTNEIVLRDKPPAAGISSASTCSGWSGSGSVIRHRVESCCRIRLFLRT